MFELVVSADFVNGLKKLDVSVQRQIKERLASLSKAENPLYFSKKIKGYKNIVRFRAGDYRMVAQLGKQKIILLFVKHRKEVYEGL